MLVFPFNCKLVLLLGLCLPLIPDASADIYLDEHGGDEIRITNIPSGDDYQLLISEQVTNVAAPENQRSMIPAMATSMPFAAAVQTAAQETALEPALIHAVIAAESGHNPKAISPRGAQGLMQLMPTTSRRFGLIDPYDPVQNIRVGAVYLRELKDMFKGDLNLALAAYNAGPAAVLRYGSRIPPFEETRRYVPRVMRLYRQLSSKQI
jgi:soluble lytic murein transglycosylase-like protein